MSDDNNLGPVSPATASAQTTNPVRKAAVDLVVFFILIAVVVLLYLFLLSALPRFSSLPAFILASGCFLLNLLFLRRTRLNICSIGLSSFTQSCKNFLAGFSGGLLLVFVWALLVLFLLSPGFQIHSTQASFAFLNLVLFYLFNNAGEELAYRAYAFLQIEKLAGRTIAILATSILFTLLHIQGGMPWLNAIAGVFTTALLFAALFAIRKSLPLALGFHYATNIGQDLFGLRQTPLSIVTFTHTSPSPMRGTVVLIIVASLNLLLAWFLLRKYPKANCATIPQ